MDAILAFHKRTGRTLPYHSALHMMMAFEQACVEQGVQGTVDLPTPGEADDNVTWTVAKNFAFWMAAKHDVALVFVDPVTGAGQVDLLSSRSYYVLYKYNHVLLVTDERPPILTSEAINPGLLLGAPKKRQPRARRPPVKRPKARAPRARAPVQPRTSTAVSRAPAARSTQVTAANSTPFVYEGSELISTLSSGPTGDASLEIVIAACSPVSFPQGSTIMNKFMRYRIEKLHYEFEPSVATSTPGLVALAFMPNKPQASDAIPDLATTSAFVMNAVWNRIPLTIKYQPTQRWLLNYSTASWDYKGPDYNLGSLMVRGQGLPINTLVGYIRVTYKIALVDRTPVLPNLTAPGLLALQDQLAQLGQPALRALLGLPELQEAKALQEHKESKDP